MAKKKGEGKKKAGGKKTANQPAAEESTAEVTDDDWTDEPESEPVESPPKPVTAPNRRDNRWDEQPTGRNVGATQLNRIPGKQRKFL